MRFYLPTEVFSEHDAVKNHAEDLKKFGKKAIIITGASSSKKNGSLADAEEALESVGTDFVVFDGVEENPSVETIMKARDKGVAENVDFCIGIGGGSPMDAAKAVALMIRHSDRDWKYLYDAGASSDALPVVEIPTTCGTGSEVTGVSVLTRHDKKTKISIPHKVFPELALIDGKYLKTCPLKVVADTAMDALAHMYESYVNVNASDFSRMFVDAGLKIWKENKKIISGEEEITDAGALRLMNAAALAGMAIAQDGTTLPHGLSYSITTLLHVPHGAAVSMFQKGYLNEAPEAMREHLLQGAGFSSTDDLYDFFEKVCRPREVPKEYLEIAVDELFQKKAKLKSVPFECTKETLMRIAGLL